MHRLFVLAILSLFTTAGNAEVVRCADAQGRVSYTDRSCPAGTKLVARVSVQEPVALIPDGTSAKPPEKTVDSRPAAPPPAPPRAAAPPPPAPPPAPVIADYGNGSVDPVVTDYGYYPYGGVYGRPVPPRDMRPRIRNCDAGGCTDTQGNHYNNKGQLNRYQGIDGRTCRPMGTTVVCR